MIRPLGGVGWQGRVYQVAVQFLTCLYTMSVNVSIMLVGNAVVASARSFLRTFIHHSLALSESWTLKSAVAEVGAYPARKAHIVHPLPASGF